MADELELRIRREILHALDIKPHEGMVPTHRLIVAASLHVLAVGKGLAQREDPDHSAVGSAGLPEPARMVLDRFFGVDGAPATDDEVRDGLCAVLVDASRMSSVLRSLNKSRPLTATAMLEFAQIYWNLDAQGERSALPIPVGEMRPSGEKAYIKVKGADADYAELELKQRADRTPGYTKAAGAFYDRGARLAAVVATRLVGEKDAAADSAKLRGTRTGRGEEWAIVWRIERTSDPRPTSADTRAAAASASPDPTIGALRQLRHSNVAEGNLDYAAILGTTLIAILRERSEKSPGDHDSQLAGEYLRSGLISAVAGRVSEAIDYLTKAEGMSEMLSDLRPDVSAHRLRLAIARLMLGQLYFVTGSLEQAEAALVDAVARSQELADEDARDEGMLAGALSVLGAIFVQTDRQQDAQRTLLRAVTISQKLAKQNPDDDSNQLLLTNSLASLGMLYFQSDDPRAEDVLGRSIAIAEALNTSGFERRVTGLLLAHDRLQLGGVYFYSDRYEEAKHALGAAAALAQTLLDQHADESTRLLLASSQFLLGLVHGVTDRADEAVASLSEVVRVSRELIADAAPAIVSPAQKTRATTFLGSALCLLGVIYAEMEREQQAEVSLVEAVEVLRERAADASDVSFLPQALEALIELYERQERADDAARMVEARRRLDDQSPGAPALA